MNGKTEEPSIKKNYIYTIVYQILVLLLPLVSTPYVSRVLGADGIGIYSYYSSIMTYFVLFAALGTQTYGSREISRNRDNRKVVSKTFWEIVIMNFLTCLVCICLWLFVIMCNQEYRWYYLALLPTLIGTPLDISWFFNGNEKVKYVVVRNTICKLISVILLFILVKTKEDLLIYFLINSCSTLLGNLSMWTYLPKMLVKVDKHNLEIKKHLKETLVYFIPTIATSVYTVMDKTLIGAITKDSYENGFYEQATKLINLGKVFVFSSLNSVVGVRISYLYAKNQLEEARERIKKSLDIILLLGYGACFGIMAVAEEFVPIFFGEGYEPVSLLLCCMAPILVIVGISNCLGSHYYTPAGKRKQSASYIVIGAASNLILNICLIPRHGAAGATIASICAELLITILYCRRCDGIVTGKILWTCSHKRIIAGVFMLISVKTIDILITLDGIWGLLLHIGIGITVYGMVLLIMQDSLIYGGLAVFKEKITKEKRNFNG